MAKIVGVVNSTHVPAIGGAIHKGMQQDPYWRPFFDGFPKVREWLARIKPDVAIVINNDHGLNFFLDKMPTFAIGAAPEYKNADEGWGIPVLPAFKGHEDLSWHLAESLIGDEFDMVTCQEMAVDHAFTLPLALLYPDMNWPLSVVPININTVLFPTPSAKALLQVRPGDRPRGRSLRSGSARARHRHRRSVASTRRHARRVHQQGIPISKFMDSLTSEPTWVTQYTDRELVKFAGTQGIELLNWLTARATMSGQVKELHRNYHIPISNTAAATLLLEPHA